MDNSNNTSMLGSAIVVATGMAILCGSFDERGFINSFDTKGFTYQKCGAELIANSHDAHASNIFINVGREKIKYIETDGCGMNEIKVGDMFAMNRSNHIGDISMGKSGLGAKPALRALSKKNGQPTTVIIYTHAEGHNYLKVIVPFDEIEELGKWTGMIRICNMDELERAAFLEDRQGKSETGTTIEWTYSETTHQYFEKQFSRDRKSMNLNDRLDCIFGKTRLNMYYKDYESDEYRTIELYNYFSGERPDYYGGIKEDIIEHWIDRDNRDHFIWENDGREWEFALKVRSTSKILEEVICKNGWTQIGFYVLKNGMRRDERLFDEKNPLKTPNKNGGFIYGNPSPYKLLSPYEDEFFEQCGGNIETTRSLVSLLQIIRNMQYITGIEMDGFRISSARANPASYMKIVLYRSELSYNTKSYPKNRMDMAIGIQENKNQHCNELPKNLMRMLSHIREERYSEIIDYFESKCKEINDLLEKKKIEEEIERLRIVELENERLRLVELERRRIEDIENERLRIVELERLRLKDIDDERLRIVELERRRIEDIENERLRLVELERLRLVELERLKIEELETLRIKEIERLQALEVQGTVGSEGTLEVQGTVGSEGTLEAKQRQVKQMIQIRLTVGNGISILKQIRTENKIQFDELINELLISYSDRSAPDQISKYLRLLTFSQRVDILLNFIDDKYKGNDEADMKGGSELYKATNN